eukprot:15462442-Alexandrium_andersonii.AAC.1
MAGGSCPGSPRAACFAALAGLAGGPPLQQDGLCPRWPGPVGAQAPQADRLGRTPQGLEEEGGPPRPCHHEGD